MQLHHISSRMSGKKRVGRGGKRGTYSGRGMKGQRARAGRKLRPAIRDLIKRIPKLRGIQFPAVPQKRLIPSVLVSVGELERVFSSGARITPKTLVEKGMIKRRQGRLPEVKLLGSGSLTKKLLVANCQISSSAKEKIENAGGTITTA